jgi:hypothetical protein
VDELVRHGLKALANTLQDGELTSKNCSVAIVGARRAERRARAAVGPPCAGPAAALLACRGGSCAAPVRMRSRKA